MRWSHDQPALAKKVAGAFLVAPTDRAAIAIAPLAGLVTLVWMALKALPKRVKDVALFLAAPFIGIAYRMAFPLIGVGILAWVGVKAARGK